MFTVSELEILAEVLEAWLENLSMRGMKFEEHEALYTKITEQLQEARGY